MKWTVQMIKTLADEYPTAFVPDLARKLGVEDNILRQMASLLGIKKEKKFRVKPGSNILKGRFKREIKNGQLRCSKCKETKSVLNFNEDPTRKSGKASWCKECFKDYYRRRSCAYATAT